MLAVVAGALGTVAEMAARGARVVEARVATQALTELLVAPILAVAVAVAQIT
jgi:hypothetical protein